MGEKRDLWVAPSDCIAANSSDYRPVSLCFVDPLITQLFADLLRSRGIEIEVIEDLAAIFPNHKVITEPLFLGKLDSTEIRRCLVVGNPSAVAHHPHSLSRPLTEEKVERALAEFLA